MNALWQDKQSAIAAAEKLKIFAQPQRLMIISALLAHEELAVSAIDEATGIGQPALSQQLAELRKSNLVETRREAKLVYYRLADELIRLCAHSIETVFGNPPKPDLTTAHTALPDHSASNSGAAAFARIL
jgi:DNA-binding transcriptional ArsR family regulator